MHLSEINIYPIKSLRGISLENSHVENRGLRFDRRWMLVDENWDFFTQREYPVMATIGVEVMSDGLSVTSETAGTIAVPLEPDRGEHGIGTVWNSRVEAVAYRGEVSEWFSDAIGMKCKLVWMPETTRRNVDPDHAVHQGEDIVSFADGYPFLLIGEGSLTDLNERLLEKYGDADENVRLPIPMNRFRPTFVVAGSESFEEDTWQTIRIGEIDFHLVKPCGRCVVTTTDQTTGERGKEPLKTLAEYRNVNGKALFGQNLIAEKPGGQIFIGDEVKVLSRKA